MTVTMTADQLQMVIATLQGITDIKQKMKYPRSCVELNKLWEKELRGVFEATREGEVAVQAHTYEQVVESTELTRPKLDIEATREGEVAVPGHTYEQVVESTELTLLRLDIEATREGEVAVPTHTYEQAVESTELTIPVHYSDNHATSGCRHTRNCQAHLKLLFCSLL